MHILHGSPPMQDSIEVLKVRTRVFGLVDMRRSVARDIETCASNCSYAVMACII